MSKPKLAFYWGAACGGCEEAFIDIGESLLDVVDKIDLVFWPVAMDIKEADIDDIDRINITFISGAIRNSDQEHVIKKLRAKSDLMIAFGTCACFGGMAGGLGNLLSKEDMLNRAFIEIPTVYNPDNILPCEKTKVGNDELQLPELFSTAHSLQQIVDVDFFIPGCSVPKDLVLYAVEHLLSGELPSKGSYLIPFHQNLCEPCERKDTLPAAGELKVIVAKRPHEIIIDPKICFLAQGLICMGISTNAGCGWESTGRCIRVNVPCRGCFGPTAENPDQGMATLISLSNMMDPNNIEQSEKFVDSIVDPEGTMYRYCLISHQETK
jgi:F420-non-reducing hydrogenase small subunit